MISVRLPSSQRLSATELPLWATPQNYYVQCEAVQRYGSSIFCWFGIVLLVLLPCCLSCLDVCSQELTDVLLQIYFWRSIVVIEQQLLIIQWWYQHIQASLSSSSINSLIIPIAVVIRYKKPSDGCSCWPRRPAARQSCGDCVSLSFPRRGMENQVSRTAEMDAKSGLNANPGELAF